MPRFSLKHDQYSSFTYQFSKHFIHTTVIPRHNSPSIYSSFSMQDPKYPHAISDMVSNFHF